VGVGMIVKFYTDSGKYRGFRNADYKNNFLELQSWIKSGNFLIVRGERVADTSRIREILKRAPDIRVIEGKTI
jgi:hypothetical protein